VLYINNTGFKKAGTKAIPGILQQFPKCIGYPQVGLCRENVEVC